MVFTESETVELKSIVTSDICKEVIAFANSGGGTLYIGVDDTGRVIGVENTDKVILQINNMVRDNIKPDVTMFVHYDVLLVECKNVIAVSIQKGTGRPYYLGNKGLKPSGVFVRNGVSTDPATDNSIRLMIKDTDGDSFESMRSLDQQLTFINTKEQFEKNKLLFDFSKMQTLGMVSNDGIYTNVALLLSDQCNSMIKAAVFSGTDKTVFQDRREFSGSLFNQMEEVYAYLDIRNKKKATFDGLYRIDTRDYPEEAIREALLNCLVHRDYSFSADTLVSVYDDRIEFVSIGGLIAGLETEDIMLGISACRNPRLAAIFYRLKLIEAYGTGIPKIIKAYSGTGLKPKIEVTNNAFKITLPNINCAIDVTDTFQIRNDEEYYILKNIEKNGFIARNDVERLLDVSQATANRIIKKMIDKKMIVQVGTGKKTRYVMK